MSTRKKVYIRKCCLIDEGVRCEKYAGVTKLSQILERIISAQTLDLVQSESVSNVGHIFNANQIQNLL